MSSASVMLRANENSSLYNSLKSRDSAIGGRGNPFLYSSEQNFAPCVKSKVEIGTQNTAGYDRVVKIELGNYGMLNKLYLKTKYSARSGTAGGSDGVALRRFAGVPFNEARLVYQGTTISRISYEYVVARLLTETDDRRLGLLNEMIQGDHVIHTGSAFTHAATKWSTDPEQRTIAGSGVVDGTQTFYCPLEFWFQESLSRNIDLGVLASPLTLELDMKSQAGNHGVITTAGTGCTIAEMSAICFLWEQHADEERAFRSVSYKPSGAPLTQIGFSTTHHEEGNVAYGSSGSIKLNDFSGQIQRLYVFAVLKSAVDSASVGQDWSLVPFESLTLKSTGTDIYKMDKLGTQKERMLEWFNTNNPNVAKMGTSLATSDVRADLIYCINFKEGWNNRGSADGSLAGGTLSIPTLHYEFAVQHGDESGVYAGANVNIHIVSENINLISYITNANGSTHLRSLTE